jgi:hypothetical protein
MHILSFCHCNTLCKGLLGEGLFLYVILGYP